MNTFLRVLCRLLSVVLSMLSLPGNVGYGRAFTVNADILTTVTVTLEVNAGGPE